jgi:hypothetical protein
VQNLRAVALRWKHINNDSRITFCDAVVTVSSQPIRKVLKTQEEQVGADTFSLKPLP